MPYLMRRVTAERLRNAFEYEVTAVGIGYVVCTLLLAIAALNTGNNLLYIIVAAMLAAILVSGVASAIQLRDLELKCPRSGTRFCRAGNVWPNSFAQRTPPAAGVFDSGGRASRGEVFPALALGAYHVCIPSGASAGKTVAETS